MNRAKLPLSKIKPLCLHYAPLDNIERIKSSHALDVLAEIYAKEKHGKESAIKALELLSARFDPVRAPYWKYRKTTAAAVTV